MDLSSLQRGFRYWRSVLSKVPMYSYTCTSIINKTKKRREHATCNLINKPKNSNKLSTSYGTKATKVTKNSNVLLPASNFTIYTGRYCSYMPSSPLGVRLAVGLDCVNSGNYSPLLEEGTLNKDGQRRHFKRSQLASFTKGGARSFNSTEVTH